MIGGGALGQQAATAVRHVAAQNGVWSLGNFGGVPPKSAMMYHQSGTDITPGAECTSGEETEGQDAQNSGVLPSKIEENDYRHVFNSCTVGMVRYFHLQCPVSYILFIIRNSDFWYIGSFFCFLFRPSRPWEEPSLIATSFSANFRTTLSKRSVL
jgi:hypothetical protein